MRFTKIMFLGIAVTVLAGIAQAQTPESKPIAQEVGKSGTEEHTDDQKAIVDADKDLSSSTLRSLSKYTLNAHLSMLSTWLPGKIGGSLGYIADENWTYELELTRKSISAKLLDVDLGQVVDQRYGVQARWFPGSNSFHFILGLFKSTFSLELGPSYLANIPGTPSTTMWKFESMGPQLGLANRWQWSNGITFGVDWFVLYIPSFNKTSNEEIFSYITNQQDKDDLEKATKAIKGIPQFDLLKLTLGYSF